jgi:hypothetical protein
MNIKLDAARALTVTKPVAITSDTIKVVSITDLPSNKKVIANISVGNITNNNLVLWSGSDYDAIGDWTQVQANNQIISLLTA